MENYEQDLIDLRQPFKDLYILHDVILFDNTTNLEG